MAQYGAVLCALLTTAFFVLKAFLFTTSANQQHYFSLNIQKKKKTGTQP